MSAAVGLTVALLTARMASLHATRMAHEMILGRHRSPPQTLDVVALFRDVGPEHPARHRVVDTDGKVVYRFPPQEAVSDSDHSIEDASPGLSYRLISSPRPIYPGLTSLAVAWGAAGMALTLLAFVLLGGRHREVQTMEAPPDREPTAVPSLIMATVSHELKTPLAAIVANVESLRDEVEGPLQPGQKEVLDIVARHARTLLSLIADLLDLSRLQADRLPITRTWVVLQECIEEAYFAVRPELEKKGLAFDVQMPEAPVVVEGSFVRLQQIFTNLLGNAVKFTAQGRIELKLETNGSDVLVHVTDTGPGIPVAAQATIFDEFRQADEGVRRRHGGAGLGLFIARRLARLHGGDLTVKSAEGQGSTFTVRLPVGNLTGR